MASIYDLYMAPEETGAAEQAAALQAAIRGKRGAALLASISGDSVLGGVGKSLDSQALEAEKELADAGYRRRDDVRLDARQKAEAQRWQQEQEWRTKRAQEEATRWQREMAWRQQQAAEQERHNRAVEAQKAGAPTARGMTAAQHANLVLKLGADLQKLETAPRDLAVLEQYVGAGDRPGSGPIVGRLPEMLVPGEEGKRLRQAAGSVYNAKLKLQTGTAVSPGEAERKAEELGFGKTSTQGAYDVGVPRFKEELQLALGNALAKYPPEVVEEARARGMLTPFMDLIKEPAPAPLRAGAAHTPPAPRSNPMRKQGANKKWYVHDGKGWTLDPNQGG